MEIAIGVVAVIALIFLFYYGNKLMKEIKSLKEKSGELGKSNTKLFLESEKKSEYIQTLKEELNILEQENLALFNSKNKLEEEITSARAQQKPQVTKVRRGRPSKG